MTQKVFVCCCCCLVCFLLVCFFVCFLFVCFFFFFVFLFVRLRLKDIHIHKLTYFVNIQSINHNKLALNHLIIVKTVIFFK